jgi:lipopolysaccharide biosynthesis glycosyltransferase
MNYRAYVTDTDSFDILKKKGYNVVYYPVQQSTEKMDFGTSGFNELSYIRYKIINELLNEDNIIWYLDVDTVVLHDLNPLVSEFIGKDIVMQNDINMPCSGCMLCYPTEICKIVVNTIYNSRTSSENDQILLAKLLYGNKQIQLALLDHEMFANGLLYFNELSNHEMYRREQIAFKQSQKPLYLVHANWIVGVETKIKEIKNKNLWYL